jgi:hypothetical protein
MDFARGLRICSQTISILLYYALPVYGQPKAQPVSVNAPHLKEICSLPKHVKEASGLAVTAKGHYWTHNDGGVPILYCLDSTGSVIKTVQLNHPNSGWEDLAVDKAGNLLVGAFGNNKNDKQNLKIYRIPNPDKIAEKVINAEIIKYTYSDQSSFPPPPAQRNFDMDAFVALGENLYLFSKNRTSPFTGYSKIYRLNNTPGEQIAILTDSLYLGKGPMMDCWVTGAAVSPDEKTLVLLSHRCLWVLTNFDDGKFSAGQLRRVDLDHISHKAGVAFDGNSRLVIVDELELEVLGGKMYTLDLSEILKNP